MKCGNKFCVYWKEEQCILEDVHLDILGVCENSIHVEISEETLRAERDNALKRMGGV